MKKPAKRNPRAIIVLGMHRSGTSALTRMVNLRGVDLGSNLMPPEQNYNEKGFWEHMDIYRLNEKLLTDLNSSWDDVRSLPEGWWESEAAQRYKLEIINILERDFAKSRFWGVKDPRICRFLPVWQPILEQIGCKPYFLIIVRNPLEVVSSLAKRDGFSQGKSCLLWLKHIIESEKGTRNTPRLFVTYEELLSDWKGLMSRAQKSFQFKWPVTLKKAGPEIASFLQKSLRHNIVNDTVLIEDSTLSRWIKDLYFETKRAVNGDDSQLIKTVTAIEAELKDAAGLYEPAVADIWKRYQINHAMLQERSQQLDDIKIRLKGYSQDRGYHLYTIDNLQKTIKEKNERIQQMDSEVLELRDQLSTVQQTVVGHEIELTHLQTANKEKNDRFQQLDTEMAEIRDQLSEVQQTVVRREAEVSHLQTVIKEKNEHIQQLDADLTDLRNKFASTQEAGLAREAQFANLQSKVKEKNERIQQLDTEVVELRDQLSEVQQTVVRRETEVTHLQIEIKDRDERIQQMDDELNDSRQELKASQGVVTEYGSTVDQLQAEIKERDERIQQLDANVGRLQDEVDSMGTQAENYRLALVAISGSNSWKLTVPLRRVSVNFGKVKHKIKTIRYLFSRQYRLINKSGLFDSAYYLDQNPDIAESGMNPLAHFLRYGAGEGRNPNPLFDTSYYFDQNPDVVESGLNPLVHYLKNGNGEGRDPNPLFDTSYYLNQDPDIAGSGMNPLAHFLRHGTGAGRNPNSLFDTSYYLEQNPDIAESGMNPLAHYLRFGAEEGRDPSPLFDTSYYLDQNPDLAESGMNPLLHYILFGRMENRLVIPIDIGADFNAKRYNRDETIVFISHAAEYAGAEKVLLDTVEWFSQHTPFKLKVLFLQFGPLVEEFTKFTETKVLNLLQDTKNVCAEITSFLPKENVILFLNTIVAMRIKKFVDIGKYCSIIFIHELEKTLQTWADEIRLLECNYLNLRLVLGASQPVINNLVARHGLPKEKANVLNAYIKPYFYDEKHFKQMRKLARKQLGLGINECAVFGCGTVYYRKNPRGFVEVADLARKLKGGERLRFFWIGVGEEMDDIKKMIAERGLGNLVDFIGLHHSPRELLAGGDVFLLPSIEDPFPLVCLEAAECRMPIICFADGGGMPDFVENDAGFVVPYLDLRKMAEKTVQLANNKDLCSQLGKNGASKIIKNHFIENSCEKLLKFLWQDCDLNPLVSIIVPNYNHAKYLSARLNSIYSQTMRDFEVLLLDDCSSDNSLEILNNYAETHQNVTKTAYTTKNSKSVFKQWAKGIEMSRGKFIWIAESDDIAEPNFLMELLQMMKDNIVIAYCDSIIIDGNDNRFGRYSEISWLTNLCPTRWKTDYENTGWREIKDFFAIKCIIPNVSGTLFRKKQAEQVILNSFDFKTHGDWIFYNCLLGYGDIAYNAKVLNYHRRHPESVIESCTNSIIIKHLFHAHKFIASKYHLPELTKNKMIAFARDDYYPEYKSRGTISEKFKELYNSKIIEQTKPIFKVGFQLRGLTFSVGGAERVLALLTEELIKNEMDIVVFIDDGGRQPPAYEFNPAVRLIYVQSLKEFGDVLEFEFPDVLIFISTGHNINPEVKLASNLGIKTIIGEQNHPPFFDDLLGKQEHEKMLECADAIHVVMPSFKEQYRKQPFFERIHVIANPVGDMALPMEQNSRSTKILLSVGRLSEQKRHDILIKAFSMIAGDFPEWKLKIVGEGHLRLELEAMIEECNLTTKISLPGVSDNMPAIYKDADIFALASDFEAFGLVIMEAASAGLPVVLFRDTPPFEELYGDCTGIYLVDRGDDAIASLSLQLSALMSEEKELIKNHSELRKFYMKFTPEKIARKWFRFITFFNTPSACSGVKGAGKIRHC